MKKNKVIFKPICASDGHYLLNLGCGQRYREGWNNIDLSTNTKSPYVKRFNLLRGIPYQNDIFDTIYSSHFFEHLKRTDAEFLLYECCRVLKKNGVIRIVIPDLEYSCRLYLDALDKVSKEDSMVNKEHYEWALLNLIDQLVRDKSGGEMQKFFKREHLLDEDFIVRTAGGEDLVEIRASLLKKHSQLIRENILKKLMKKIVERLMPFVIEDRFSNSGEKHKWMYDRFSIKEMLIKAGFTEVIFWDAYKSMISNFSRYHLDLTVENRLIKPNSLYIEASKVYHTPKYKAY